MPGVGVEGMATDRQRRSAPVALEAPEVVAMVQDQLERP